MIILQTQTKIRKLTINSLFKLFFSLLSLQSNKADSDIRAEQSASTSNFPGDRQESFHQKSGTEFVDSVQLHCKSIMERMRVIKQAVDGKDGKDSLVSSDQNPVDDASPESTNDGCAQKFSEMNPREQGQKIKERVERIVKLVQCTAQKVS